MSFEKKVQAIANCMEIGISYIEESANSMLDEEALELMQSALNLLKQLTPPKPRIVVKELSRSDQDNLLGFDWLNYLDDAAARKAYQQLFEKIVLNNVTIE